MKVIDIYRSALMMCGSNTNDEYVLGEENDDKLYFVNRALMDLRREMVYDLASPVYYNQKTIDAIVCGVAFYLAVKYCKTEIATYLSQLYDRKRAIALGAVGKIHNSQFFRQ